ncbi:MAG: OmpA family protein, partial [Desulfobacterales bacterium]
NLALLINGEMASIPTDDIQLLVENLNEVVEIKGNTLDKQILFQTEPGLRGDEQAWRLNIMDARGKVVRTLSGKGSLPNTIRWNGWLDNQQTVKGGEIYQYQMVVEYADGSQATSARKLFGINQTTAIFLNLTGEAFITDSAELSPKAKEILKETAAVLRKYAKEKVIIEGHTDSVGSDEYNIDLSRRRAESALTYLVNEERLPQERFVVRWYGESRPLASNEYAETRALNRRIEIKGQVDDLKRSKLYDQYRTKPSVKINGEPVKVDSNGRFSLEVADKSVKQFEIEVINVRGQSYKTTIDVPTVEILNREDKILLPYGGTAAGYKTGGTSTAQTPDEQKPLVTYDLLAKTEPGNSVEIDGASIPVMTDGTFQTTLSLKRGNNPFGLLVRNPAGISRIVNLMVTVNDQDEDGKLLLATGPAPNLLVELPPKGVPLTSHQLTVSGATDLENQVFINDKPVKVEINGHFSTMVNLPKGKSLLNIKAVNPEGHISVISREVEVKDTQLFFLAFVDGKIENLWGDGFIEGAGMDHDSEFFTEGRIAFYLKGVIKGKYLITAALDTGTDEFDKLFEDLDDRENDRLLTNLDPDKIYPVYGDSSTVVYDTDSQGKLYLALDSDDLHLLLGNYALNLNDTELAAYQRTLYGARLSYQSVSQTQYGQPNTKIAIFGAEVDQIPITDELRATGGSLYYLSHREVIEGSEQVTIVIRDKNTGLILARKPQEQNVDYTIKYDGGRILFTRPISSFVEDDTLINQDLLPGSKVFIQVDYEAREDLFDNTAAGGHIRQQIGDHVAVGGTYVKDELSTGEYELQAVDAEIRLGKNTRLIAEYARSDGTDAQIFVSDDGGITFSESAPSGFHQGDAWKAAVELDVGEWFGSPDRYQIGGYYKRLEPGFFTSRNFSEEGTEKSGLNMSLELTAKDKIHARFDRLETDATSLSDETKTDIGTLQWIHDHGWWSLTGEYQYRDSEDQTTDSADSDQYAAARLTVNPIDTLTVKAEHQQTITGAENDQTTLGVEYQIHPSLALEASAKTATDGQAAWGGAILTLGDKRFYLTERLVDDKAGRSTATVLGAESPMGASGKVYSEYQWEHSEKKDLNKSVLGARQQWEVTEGLKVDLSGEYSSADSDPEDSSHLTISSGLSYAHPAGFKFTTRNEIRQETGEDEFTQFLTSNFAEIKLNPDFTALGKFRYSETIDDDTDETAADFTEFSIGLAFRPVAYDRFNALAKYTLLFQEGPQELGEEEIFRPKTQVASIDFSLDVTRWLEWVEKGAFKINEEEIAGMPDQTTNTYLWINRLNFNIWKDFDLGVEYRMLFQPEADDNRQGFLTELMWEPVDHFRVGVGYNFTDFSDNEFSNNDYSSHGLFMRFQATF